LVEAGPIVDDDEARAAALHALCIP
jgi:hypothetical protein